MGLVWSFVAEILTVQPVRYASDLSLGSLAQQRQKRTPLKASRSLQVSVCHSGLGVASSLLDWWRAWLRTCSISSPEHIYKKNANYSTTKETKSCGTPHTVPTLRLQLLECLRGADLSLQLLGYVLIHCRLAGWFTPWDLSGPHQMNRQNRWDGRSPKRRRDGLSHASVFGGVFGAHHLLFVGKHGLNLSRYMSCSPFASRGSGVRFHPFRSSTGE